MAHDVAQRRAEFAPFDKTLRFADRPLDGARDIGEVDGIGCHGNLLRAAGLRTVDCRPEKRRARLAEMTGAISSRVCLRSVTAPGR